MNSNTLQLLSPVPTTRVLAIGHFVTEPDPAVVKPIMPKEMAETASLYLDGKIAEWFSRQDESGVVFLLNVGSVSEARTLLDGLPFGIAGLMAFDLIPLGPLKPLRLLIERGHL